MGIRHRPRVYTAQRQPDEGDRRRADESASLVDLPVERIAEAPIIWFDGVPVYGVSAAGGRIALETVVQEPAPDGGIANRRVAVAHLRFGVQALYSLEQAVLGIKKILELPPLTPSGAAGEGSE